MIEQAYLVGENFGLAVWTEDEAGPFQTVPFSGNSWQEEGCPLRQASEYIRNGTAKMLTLFHPQDGQVRVKGVRSCTNVVLHKWMRQELGDIVEHLPAAVPVDEVANHLLWERWQEGLMWPITLPVELPPLRMLLVMDNLKGHKTPEMVLWMFAQGIMPMYTPLGGSWLNMAESIQRIIKRRGLDCQHPQTPEESIGLLEATARGWNREPTPFEWGGARAARRARSRQRRHAIGGSGACASRPVRWRTPIIQQWQQSCQLTH
ncbi:MAG: transposase [Blastocatellia bacterium]